MWPPSRRSGGPTSISIGLLLGGLLFFGLACTRREAPPETGEGASILLVTLDTTRADRLGTEAGPRAGTPVLDSLAARGVRFTRAYTTVPLTLPAHTSMLTGLYPAAHGVHENARTLSPEIPLLAEALAAEGYRTAAFVSGLPLARRFGLARGFERYDDEVDGDDVSGNGASRDDPPGERRAAATTDRALAHLESLPAGEGAAPVFLWVHYFDPHDPYDPPEPYRSRFAADPYQGEIAYLDAQLGRLLAAFDIRAADGGGRRVLVAGDHGEGLGEHGEPRHGNLLYESTMRVPLLIAGDGVGPAVRTAPVSTRRVYDTVLGWAHGEAAPGLLGPADGAVAGEAMKPFLQYGWQPQVMAVAATGGSGEGGTTVLKAIRSGETEIYDLGADPGETRDLVAAAGETEAEVEAEIGLPRPLRQALRDYPSPPPRHPSAADRPALSREEEKQLASLGYVTWSSGGGSGVRPDAPSPRRMAHLFAPLDRGSALFVQEDYATAIPVFERVLADDPHNLAVVLRLAVSHSLLGRDRRARELFERARTLDPSSADVRHYLGLHHLRHGRPADAAPLLASVVAEQPHRLPAVTALAEIRAGQGRLDEAIALLERADRQSPDDPRTLTLLGELAMARGDTPRALSSFERVRDLRPTTFEHHLELGVLYLAARRLPEARDALDQVPEDHPAYPMALFKRAQVAVLLDEPDQATRIQAARAHADATTRPLIEAERLF